MHPASAAATFALLYVTRKTGISLRRKYVNNNMYYRQDMWIASDRHAATTLHLTVISNNLTLTGIVPQISNRNMHCGIFKIAKETGLRWLRTT